MRITKNAKNICPTDRNKIELEIFITNSEMDHSGKANMGIMTSKENHNETGLYLTAAKYET